MTRRQGGGIPGLVLHAALCGAFVGPACSGAGTKGDFQVEGPSDTGRRYDGQAPLGEPPVIDPSHPGADYLRELAGNFQPAWRSFLEDCRLRLPPDHELNTQSLRTILEIVLNQGGEIMAVKTAQSSNNPTFDQVATEIVRDLQSLPKAPAEWLSDDERVHIRWSFARDERQAGSAGAEILRVELPVEQALPKLLAGGQFATAAHRLLKAEASDEQLLQLTSAIVEKASVSADPVQNILALDAIAKAKLSALAAPARASLNSAELGVGIAAVHALSSVGSDADLAQLSALAAGENGAKPDLSSAAAQALISLGKSAALKGAAAKGLTSELPETRLAALAVFSVLVSDEEVGALSNVLGSAQSSRAEKTAAAKALGRQAATSPAAVKSLLQGAGGQDAAVRAACMAAIADAAQLGLHTRLAYWKAVELLKDKDERVRAHAIEAAAALDAKRFASELNTLKAGGSKMVLMSLARALENVPGPLAVSRLLDLSAVDHTGMRLAATKSLLAHDDERAHARLAELLVDQAPELRLAALPSVKTAEGLEALLADSAGEVQGAAMQALVALKGRRATTALLLAKLSESSDSPTLQLRWACAWLHGS